MRPKQRLELTWIGKDEDLRLEPRILIEDSEKSYGDKGSENMLIHGDNLLALKALEQDFSGKIKCVYIDPPYNTGNAFEHYDDGLEHSIWLSLIKPRLEVLKKLLSPDGVIVVQIGYDEMAYLKILMDEVFLRDHCIGQVSVRMSHSAGMKRRAADKRLIKNTEYLLIYYRDTPPTLKPLHEISQEFPVNYYQWINSFPEKDKPGKYSQLATELSTKFPEIFSKHGLKATNRSVHLLFLTEEKIKEYIFSNKDRIARKHGEIPNLNCPEDLKPDDFVRLNSESRDYFMGRSENGSQYQLIPLTEKVKEIDHLDEDGNLARVSAMTNLLGDWWDGYWRDMSRVDVEGGVLMKESKKPERLIKNIFELVTDEDDWVLDSFLGSGTTAAVAQKMRRRWIGIELGDHALTLAQPRLKNVVDGKDDSGITEVANWKGGSGFRFYNLAPSLLKQDRYGNWVIDDAYNPDMLAHAVAKHEGFRYNPHPEMYWKQGISNERDYIFTTTNLLTVERLDRINEELAAGESLLICAKSFQLECEDKYEKITIKKIPQAILGRCEFGKENYNLNILRAVEDAAADNEA